MRNHTITVVLVSLCLLVPAAVKLSFAIVLAVAVMYLMIAIIQIRKFVSRFLSGSLSRVSELCFSILAAILFERCLAIVSPVLASLLYTYLVLAVVPAYLLVYFAPSGQEQQGFVQVKTAFFKGFQFSIYILMTGGVREILGTGSISLPSRQGFTMYQLFSVPDYYFLKFVVSTGGALLLFGMIAALSQFMRKHINIAKRILHE